MSGRRPLSSLAPNSTRKGTYSECKEEEPSCGDEYSEHHEESYSHEHHEGYSGYWAWYILIFVIVVVVVWLILSAFRPTWVQQTNEAGEPNGELDAGKSILWSVIIALGICILFWIIGALAYGSW